MKACILHGNDKKKAAEEMSYAWHRSEDTNGYCLSLSE